MVRVEVLKSTLQSDCGSILSVVLSLLLCARAPSGSARGVQVDKTKLQFKTKPSDKTSLLEAIPPMPAPYAIPPVHRQGEGGGERSGVNFPLSAELTGSDGVAVMAMDPRFS